MKIAVRVVFFLVALSTAFLGRSVYAQTQDGLYIVVNSPITTESYQSIKAMVEKSRGSNVKPPAKIVFDFNPNNKDSSTPDSGACADLAQFITTVADIPTIAFVHGKVSGHTVLPTLACQELVMSKSASIGEIVSGNQVIRHLEANSYEFLLRPRRGSQMAAIAKMHDVNIEVQRGKDKAGGVLLVEKGKAPADVIIADPTVIPFTARGKIGIYTAEQAQDLGLCRTRAESLSELAEKFNLNPLRAELSVDRPPLAFRCIISGEMTKGKQESVNRMIADIIRQKATLLFLQLECGGGDLIAARDLATDLQKVQNMGENPDTAIKIVAFIPDNAPDTAAIIAFGCSDIVMSRRKDLKGEGNSESKIIDFEAYVTKGNNSNSTILTESIAKLLEEKSPDSQLLAKGMFDRDLELVRVRSIKDREKKRLMTSQELNNQKAEWEQEKIVKTKGQLLKLSASEAEQLGLVRFLVDNREIGEVGGVYGFEGSKIREATPGWLDNFAAFLRIPAVTMILALILFTGLFLELKVPGTTFPGIVAALAFILLFWAHTQFSGQVAILAGLLFVLGLVLLLLEFFVIPGFGATGILGILFILSSLALLTMDSIPTDSAGWNNFAMKVATFLFVLIGAGVLAFSIAKFLPQIPYANKLILTPPSENVDIQQEIKDTVAGAAQAMELIGAIGTTVTVLRPAGNVLFGDQFVDVVADGGYIPSGARVKVILVEGNRIVVKEV